jgi:spore coat polysaccharide biosynthesis protein SpsF
MKIVASIQARLSSTRLPGKVLKEICNKPMLQWQIDRIRKSRLIDEVVVATTTNPVDDKIYEFCNKNKILCFRGSENDVLDRISSLISKHKVDIHVECFGDSPLIDPSIIDEFVGYLLKNFDKLDFVSNSIKTTYPPGAEVIVYKGNKLLIANEQVSKEDPLREHVSMHMYSKPSLFAIKNLEAPSYLNYPNLFMEVDTPEDFAVMSFIIEKMQESDDKFFTTSQIIKLLKENPDIASINTNVKRRWKEFRNDL